MFQCTLPLFNSHATMLLCSSKTLIQGLSCGNDTRRVASGRLINPVNGGTAITYPLAKYPSREVISSSRSWHCSLGAPKRLSVEPLLCCVGVNLSLCIVISGYWTGPDVDDGWGFVEASVYQLT